MVRIFEKINQVIPSKLLMVGDGPERRNAEELARDLGICDVIRFLGKQDAIEEILSIADLFLMPSGSESFGLAALEAMACKVPVISSNTGGVPELNKQGFSGFLSDVGDIDSMAENAIRILKDDVTLAQFKENALIRAQDFELTKIVPYYEEFYAEVIENLKMKIKLVKAR